MTRYDFLTAVLPPIGFFCSVGIKTHVRQYFHDSLESLEDNLQKLSLDSNTYFALATFKSDEGRTVENASQLKSFFLDLDCEPGNPHKFPDQETALRELRAFLKDTKLPHPTLVNSGRGIHVYWLLEAAVDVRDWRGTASSLKKLCALKGFKADPAVTADAARILRAPETKNWKNPANPLDVEVIKTGNFIPYEVFKKLLPTFEFIPAGAPNPLFNRLAGNKQARFKTILEKISEGKGCGQLAYGINNQESISEPLWRACLSIAANCIDSERAIHYVSKHHPDYSYEETEKKASSIKGPYTCETFEGLNPQGCVGCAHKGKIKSPIVLGHEVVADDRRGPDSDKEPRGEVDDTPAESAPLPELPFPYCRGRNGGIYRRGGGGDGENDELVYENDLYIVKFIDDPHDGMSALVRLHLPHEHVKEFVVPFKNLVTKDKLRDDLAAQGLLAYGKQMEAILRYLNDSGKAMQQDQQAEKARVQFGWLDDYTKFIVGTREINAVEIKYSPPSSVTHRLAPLYEKRGDLEEWKKIVNFYNRPGMELHAFVLFCGFGSPLLEILNMNGGIVSLVSGDSGTGKTTTLNVVNSIYGHPRDTMLITEDTVNAQIHRIGILRNIISTTDEITNKDPQHVSDYLYQYLQGRGKNRMERSSNTERVNTSSWSAINIVTANSYLRDKVFALKSLPDGELMRFMEFTMDRDESIPKEVTDANFRKLHDHYGLACEPYLQTLIQNPATIRKRLDDTQSRIDKEAGLTQKERFWSSMAAAAITGGWVAHNIGLHTIPVGRVAKWLVGELKRMRGDNKSSKELRALAVGSFLHDHINDTLIINGLKDPRNPKLSPAPIREPRQRLLIRYEPDTKLLFISSGAFRDYCAKKQLSYQEVVKDLMAHGIWKDSAKKRLGAGSSLQGIPVAVMILQNTESFLEDELEELVGDIKSAGT